VGKLIASFVEEHFWRVRAGQSSAEAMLAQQIEVFDWPVLDSPEVALCPG
jgi:hypothetical protein